VGLASDIVKEILDSNLSDQPLLEMVDQILNEIACYDKLLHLREQLAIKNPQDQTLATKLFQLYTYANDYQKMSAKAIQLEKSLGNPDYGLYSIEALYLNSQVKGASPFLINLAVGYLEKQR
jgi:GTPase involved in cell partitioning and DNA repair